jgi:hypothetical protein
LILPAEEPAPTASLEDRICHLLWVFYPEIEPGLILAPTHQDLRRLAGMAADMQKMYRLHNEQLAKRAGKEVMERSELTSTAPEMPYPPEIINNEDGVGIYFNRGEGTEMMVGFDEVIEGLEKRGNDLTEDEAAAIQDFIESEAISPGFVQRVVQDYGAESIAEAFLIRNSQEHPYYLDYLLRRYKGHFYRKSYPQVTLVD